MRFFWWRFRVALILWRRWEWRWGLAWGYAREMRDPYFSDGGDDGPMSPQDAISEDRHYWD